MYTEVAKSKVEDEILTDTPLKAATGWVLCARMLVQSGLDHRTGKKQKLTSGCSGCELAEGRLSGKLG